MSSFRSKDFKKLKSEWYSKLKDSGFEDLENKYGQLYEHNHRTIADKNRDGLFEYFYYLEHYLTEKAQLLRPKEHKVLLLYSQGNYAIEIARKMFYKVDKEVYKIIKKHKPLIMSFVRKETDEGQD